MQSVLVDLPFYPYSIRVFCLIIYSKYIPIVILAILAERFAHAIVEEDLSKAFHILTPTILVTIACYGVYSSDMLMGIMICFSLPIHHTSGLVS